MAAAAVPMADGMAEAAFRTALDALVDPVLILDPLGRCLWRNRAAADLTAPKGPFAAAPSGGADPETRFGRQIRAALGQSRPVPFGIETADGGQLRGRLCRIAADRLMLHLPPSEAAAGALRRVSEEVRVSNRWLQTQYRQSADLREARNRSAVLAREVNEAALPPLARLESRLAFLEQATVSGRIGIVRTELADLRRRIAEAKDRLHELGTYALEGMSALAQEPLQLRAVLGTALSVAQVICGEDEPFEIGELPRVLGNRGLTNRVLVHVLEAAFGSVSGDDRGLSVSAASHNGLVEICMRLGRVGAAHSGDDRALERLSRAQDLAHRQGWSSHFGQDRDGRLAFTLSAPRAHETSRDDAFADRFPG
ncbi:MAG: hypothetical protein ACFBSD_01665 [Paracoccaceae bacterium]